MSRFNYFLDGKGKLTKFDAHKTPIFKEKNNVDWVLYGDDIDWRNLYPDYLIHLYNSSAKHNTIVNKKSSYIVGRGLRYDSITNSVTSDYIKGTTFVAKLEDSRVLEKTAKDLVLQGGFANEIIYNRGNEGVTPYHIDFSKIRVSKQEWDDEEGRYKDPVYYYTCDWSARKPRNNPDFTIFHPFKYGEEGEKDKRYLLYYKEYRPDLGVYPLPEYVAAVPYIASDYQISNFTYNNVKNGFSSGFLVNFNNGQPSEQQKAEITRMYKDTFHGTDSAGKSMISFNEDKESGVEITPINPNGQDDRFLNLNNSIRDEIYTGHGVDPVIVGLKGDNGFSNNADEKRVAIEGWTHDYVKGKQQIFEDYFTSLLLQNGITGKVEILQKEPIKAQMSEQTLLQIATTDELRKMAGLGASSLEKNIVADALSSLSPLLATKVLDTMTTNEIRQLINLDAAKDIATTPEVTEVMSSVNEFESYSDYPKGATSNAQRALDWAETNGWGDCGTMVGKQRANQLAKGEPISLETIKRAYSFLSRHEQNKDVPYSEGCGGLMYDAWGGDAMKRYAKAKIKKVEEMQLIQMFENCGINDDELFVVDSRQTAILSTEDAFSKAKEYVEQFASKLSINILRMIIGKVPDNSIQKSLKISQEEYDESIEQLKAEGLLNEEGEPTEKGKVESKEDELFVVYKYVVRSDASGGSLLPTSRPFCVRLIGQSAFKSWTIEDINAMNNGMTYSSGRKMDVFRTRGGWKTIKGSSPAIHTPFCRHIWEQRLVTRKKQ